MEVDGSTWRHLRRPGGILSKMMWKVLSCLEKQMEKENQGGYQLTRFIQKMAIKAMCVCVCVCVWYTYCLHCFDTVALASERAFKSKTIGPPIIEGRHNPQSPWNYCCCFYLRFMFNQRSLQVRPSCPKSSKSLPKTFMNCWCKNFPGQVCFLSPVS